MTTSLSLITANRMHDIGFRIVESASTSIIYRAYGYTRGTGIACCSTQIMILAFAAYDFIAEAFRPTPMENPLWCL